MYLFTEADVPKNLFYQVMFANNKAMNSRFLLKVNDWSKVLARKQSPICIS
jgi:hypothetical protein